MNKLLSIILPGVLRYCLKPPEEKTIINYVCYSFAFSGVVLLAITTTVYFTLTKDISFLLAASSALLVSASISYLFMMYNQRKSNSFLTQLLINNNILKNVFLEIIQSVVTKRRLSFLLFFTIKVFLFLGVIVGIYKFLTKNH